MNSDAERPFVVLGAGQIGALVAQKLTARGEPVKVVRRSSGGDLSDFMFAQKAAAGARAIIHCAVPPYHQWLTQLEPLNAGVLHAAKTSKAPLIVLDNLYGYGKPTAPLTETSPVNPCSRKGELRARIAEQQLDAHRRGDARVAIARASDFYGPNVTLAATFGERFLGRVVKGQSGECFGDPTLPHSYSYAGDVADGLITLALESERSVGEVWHLPVAQTESTESIVKRFGRALGFAKELQTNTIPSLVLRVMALFVPAVKELLEMRYQWQLPFVLDDSKFRSSFGAKAKATSLDDGVAATVAWLKASRPAAPPRR